MSTDHFCLWLAAQTMRADPVGYLAQGYVADKDAPKARRAADLRSYMRDLDYHDNAMAALDVAEREFDEQRKVLT